MGAFRLKARARVARNNAALHWASRGELNAAFLPRTLQSANTWRVGAAQAVLLHLQAMSTILCSMRRVTYILT
jgi:hypothetical protein